MKDTYLYYTIFLGIILLGISSCNNEDINQVTAIEITHDTQSQVIFVGNTFIFQVKGNNSTEVTTAATIKVDGEAITGNTFVTDSTPKSYNVQAFYEGLESDVITVSTNNGFAKNVLIEDYTGTWCVNCPRLTYAINEAKSLSDNIVSVAVHVNSGAVIDPFSFDGSENLNNVFAIPWQPAARLNRTDAWSYPEENNLDQAINMTGFSPIGLAIESQINANRIEGFINIKFLADTTEELKVVLYLVENGLLYDQHNNTDYFGGTDPLVDFEHNDVLRAIYTDVYGEAIPTSETTEENTYSFELSKIIPSTVANNEHLHLVAFILNADTGEVINVRESAVGESQDFQL